MGQVGYEAARRLAGNRAEAGTPCLPLDGSRDEVLRRHLPLVRRVVQRLAARKPPHIETDDLVSWGIVGLLDAIAKYDSKKEASFSTYAQFRIRGAILDHLRSLDWVPRSVRQKASLIEKVSRQLEGTLGRPPLEEEIASELGVSLDAYQELLTKVGEMSLFSLEDLGFGGGEERFSFERAIEEGDADPLGTLLTRERVAIVTEAIRRLPERERTVVTLYYHEELTMKEVGGVLGLTESRVSQLHSQAVLRMKGYLRELFQPAAEEA
ncbi:MAG: FliA/WhiG family RNA polymerase sigma factor [Deltaproteobacteria bacterium]|nr:MAG: FliA/WhiG family RNA polymerase sigma factor [Deltaproteobacteria bacterium]